VGAVAEAVTTRRTPYAGMIRIRFQEILSTSATAEVPLAAMAVQ